jgi:CrcB protein
MLERRLAAAVVLGGAAGALARVALARALAGDGAGWPWHTFTANVLGSLAIGVVAERLRHPHGYQSVLHSLLGAGLCGALTTFSTFQLELVDLGRAGRPGLAAAYAAASLGACLLAVPLAAGLGGRWRR